MPPCHFLLSLKYQKLQHRVSGLNKWLHQKGFTYKKPKGVPHKADADKQAEFVKHYDALKASLPYLFNTNIEYLTF